MSIEELQLRNFRGIKILKEPMRFGELNVVIGKNNSGKTSLLEALALLPHPKLPLPILEKVKSRILTISEILHESGDLRTYVYGYHGTADVVAKIAGHELAIKIHSTGDFEVRVDSKPLSVESTSIEPSVVPIHELAKDLGIEFPENYLLFIMDSDKFFSQLEKSFADVSEWSSLENMGAHVKVVRDVIAKHIDEKLTEILPRFNELYLRKERGNGISMYIRLSDLGMGIRRCIDALLWLEALKPKVVLWDGIEAYMYIPLLKDALQKMLEMKCQVILTTYSIEALRSILEIGAENLKIFFIRRTIDDCIEHYEIPVDRLRRDIDKLKSITELEGYVAEKR